MLAEGFYTSPTCSCSRCSNIPVRWSLQSRGLQQRCSAPLYCLLRRKWPCTRMQRLQLSHSGLCGQSLQIVCHWGSGDTSDSRPKDTFEFWAVRVVGKRWLWWIWKQFSSSLWNGLPVPSWTGAFSVPSHVWIRKSCACDVRLHKGLRGGTDGTGPDGRVELWGRLLWWS